MNKQPYSNEPLTKDCEYQLQLMNDLKDFFKVALGAIELGIPINRRFYFNASEHLINKGWEIKKRK